MTFQKIGVAAAAAAGLSVAVPSAAIAQQGQLDPATIASPVGEPDAAQTAEAAEGIGEEPIGLACCTIPAGTPVAIEIVEPVSSRTGQRGDRFAIRLVEPIVVGEVTLVPAGASGVGEIVHAARARGGGKAGELILAARYLEHEGQRIPLRTLRYGRSGEDNDNLVFALSVAGGVIGGVAAAFITGHNVDVPAGFQGNARTAAEVVLNQVPAEDSISEGNEL